MNTVVISMLYHLPLVASLFSVPFFRTNKLFFVPTTERKKYNWNRERKNCWLWKISVLMIDFNLSLIIILIEYISSTVHHDISSILPFYYFKTPESSCVNKNSECMDQTEPLMSLQLVKILYQKGLNF